MRVSEQPGRWVAVCGVAPFLLYVALRLQAHRDVCLARLVATLAAVFVAYEAFWLACYRPKEIVF